MIESSDDSFAAFAGDRLLGRGSWRQVVTIARDARQSGLTPVVILSELTGETRDLEAPIEAPAPRAPRGRPKLGVTAREVTLLPRHWEWLAEQPGGASATLRRLVELARKQEGREAHRLRAQTSVHRAMTTLAGDLPGYEDALRALYGGDQGRFEALLSSWPPDVAGYITAIAKNQGAFPQAT